MVQTTDINYNWTITLGELIDKLSSQDTDKLVYLGVEGDNPSKPRSYRGYYDNLAIGTDSDKKTVKGFLLELEEADGKVYTGYKGGEYLMNSDTDVWASEYGLSSGIGIVDVSTVDDYVLLITAEVD